MLLTFIFSIFSIFSVSIYAALGVFTVGQYSQVLAAQSEYVKTMAEARLEYARSEYQLALARGEYEKVKMIQEYGKRLKRDMQLLARQETQSRQAQKLIESKARTARVLISGKHSERAWLALDYFLQIVIPYQLVREVLSQEIDINLNQDEFYQEKEREYPAFGGQTVGELFSYLRKYDLSFEKYLNVYQVIIEAVGKLSEPADEMVLKLQDRVDQIKTSTFDIWKPPEFFLNAGGFQRNFFQNSGRNSN